MPARIYQKAYCDRFAGLHATAYRPQGRLHRTSRVVAKTPRLLTAEQRDAFVRIPADLSERDLGRFYTLSARDLEIIARHRRPANRLGFAVHLGLLRFPGRTLADVPEIPERVVSYIAQQVDVDPAVFVQYRERDNTIFEHLDELRREFGFQNCGWPQLHALGQELLPLALESDRSLPLIETGVERLRAQQIIAPGMTTLEGLVWSVQRLAQRRVEHDRSAASRPTSDAPTPGSAGAPPTGAEARLAAHKSSEYADSITPPP